MISRLSSLLAALALLTCCWWMVDANRTSAEVEVSLGLVVTRPGWTVERVVMTVDDDETNPVEGLYPVARTEGTCADLREIETRPISHSTWSPLVWTDGSPACRLTGHWRLADLTRPGQGGVSVNEHGDLFVLTFDPRGLRSSIAGQDVLDFELLARFPGGVLSYRGHGEVDGTTVRWTGADQFLGSTSLTATGTSVPLLRRALPWIIGGLALLSLGVALWPGGARSERGKVLPRVQASSADSSEATAEPPLPALPASTRAPAGSFAGRQETAASSRRPVAPDPDSPWRRPERFSADGSGHRPR